MGIHCFWFQCLIEGTGSNQGWVGWGRNGGGLNTEYPHPHPPNIHNLAKNRPCKTSTTSVAQPFANLAQSTVVSLSYSVLDLETIKQPRNGSRDRNLSCCWLRNDLWVIEIREILDEDGFLRDILNCNSHYLSISDKISQWWMFCCIV